MIGALQLFLDLYMAALLLVLLPGNASRLLRPLLAVVLLREDMSFGGKI